MEVRSRFPEIQAKKKPAREEVGGLDLEYSIGRR